MPNQYPPDWITFRCPLPFSYPRGLQSTKPFPETITVRVAQRELDLIDLECEHLQLKRSMFVRVCAVMAARFLHEQRTGMKPEDIQL